MYKIISDLTDLTERQNDIIQRLFGLLCMHISADETAEIEDKIRKEVGSVDTPITRAEHNEFVRRVDEENKRQDKRIELLETQTKEITEQNTAIERLATNMEHMLAEQVAQGKRLKVLEDRDGAMWRKIVSYAVTAAIGVIVGYICKKIGF